MSDLAAVRRLLDPQDPADALASYYALHHDRAKTRLTLHRDPAGQPDGFLVSCRTGQDLFRPVVTLRAADREGATDLFRTGLTPGLPALVMIPDPLVPVALTVLQITDLHRNRVYVLDASRFQPQINIMVQAERGPGGLPLFVVRAASGQTVARAGLVWKSPEFAQISVSTDPSVPDRGYDRSVLIALVGWLLEAHLRPVYYLADDDPTAIHLAESVGFVDTGAREVSGQGVLQLG